VKGLSTGQTINFIIGENPDTTDPSQNIYGVGTLQNDLRECRGLGLGTLTGPRYGSTGDWGTNRPPYIRIISGYAS